MTDEEYFLHCYRDELADLLAEYGFQFAEIVPIHRGQLIVLKKNGDRILIANCDVLVLDLILKEDEDLYWQVCCTRAIWYCGVREMKKCQGLQSQLALFKRYLPQCCGKLLAGDLSAVDSRYCFAFQETAPSRCF